MSGLISIVTPVLLHMLVSNTVAALFGQRLDAASCTAVAALIVLPFVWAMYRQDRIRAGGDISAQETHAGQSREVKDTGIAGKILFGVFCIAAGAVLNVVWSTVLNAAGIQNVFSNETQEVLLAGSMAVQLAGLCFLVPLAEELIFRVLVYGRMKRYFPVKTAAVLSSLLFALYHGNPIQIIFAFPMALALTAVYEHGQLFVFPVLFHIGSNAAAVVFPYFF